MHHSFLKSSRARVSTRQRKSAMPPRCRNPGYGSSEPSVSRLLKKPIGFVALDRLRVNVQERASAYRSSRASPMDLFEQPATELSNLLNFYTSRKFLVR